VGDSRHNARMIALQLLFELSFPGFEPINNSSPTLVDSISKEKIDQNYDQNLVHQLITGVKKYYEKIDAIISNLAPEWPLANINKVDLQILRIAICEAYIIKITPEKVAINEAIELSKEFNNEQSRKFVSGVLGNLLRNKSKYTTSIG